jgi:hypothetical protein
MEQSSDQVDTRGISRSHGKSNEPSNSYSRSQLVAQEQQQVLNVVKHINMDCNVNDQVSLSTRVIDELPSNEGVDDLIGDLSEACDISNIGNNYQNI